MPACFIATHGLNDHDGKPARAVILARSYGTSVDDLWDAVTTGERIPRWFLSICGELKLGGRYQLPTQPGYSVTLKPESIAEFSFPDGPTWR